MTYKVTDLDKAIMKGIIPYSDIATKFREATDKLLETAREVENIINNSTAISESDKVALHAMKNAGLLDSNNSLHTLASAVDKMGLLNIEKIRDEYDEQNKPEKLKLEDL